MLDLHPVGLLYTDLHDDGSGRGRVENHRNAGNYFVSSAECIFIAQQQLAHPNACRYSPSGYYGSKFVTVILSGDEEGNVGLFCYQVSLQCQAVVKAGIVAATTDPGMMMVVLATIIKIKTMHCMFLMFFTKSRANTVEKFNK